MPHFLSAENIPMKKRKPHLDRYRRQLRDALTNPAITDEQRAEIKRKLEMVGKPRVYGGKPVVAPTPPPVGENDPDTGEDLQEEEDTEETEPSPELDDLLSNTKDELLELAEDEGVEVRPSWTKAKIAKAILESRAH